MARRRSEKWKENIGKGVTKKTPEIIEKLRQAFGLNMSVEDACVYAGIAKSTYYLWIQKDEKLSNEFELVRLNPILRAFKSIIEGLSDPNFALKYLEKYRPEMFGNKTKIEHAGQVRQVVVDESRKEAMREAIDAANQKLREIMLRPPGARFNGEIGHNVSDEHGQAK